MSIIKKVNISVFMKSMQIFDEIVNRLVKELNPEKIFLFGSYAWGKPDKGSDIDLYIIMKQLEEPKVNSIRRAHKCLRGLNISKDIILNTEFNTDNCTAIETSFERKIVNEGLLLYARESTN